jgi:hypothetical protein
MGLLLNAVRELSAFDVITPENLDQISNFDEESEKAISTVKQTNKLISQLIAQAWFDDNPDLFNREAIVKILLDINIIDSSNEIDAVVDNNPYTPELWARWNNEPPPPPPPAKSFIGYMHYSEDPSILHLYTPFPIRPQQVTNSQLDEWIKDKNEEHFVPNSVYMPATC